MIRSRRSLDKEARIVAHVARCRIQRIEEMQLSFNGSRSLRPWKLAFDRKSRKARDKMLAVARSVYVAPQLP